MSASSIFYISCEEMTGPKRPFGLENPSKFEKTWFFVFSVKMLKIGPGGFKSVPKHPPKLKTHVRHPECVIWKFYSLWKIHIFGTSEGFFEFLLISSKLCEFWLIFKFNRLFWYECLDQTKQGECSGGP